MNTSRNSEVDLDSSAVAVPNSMIMDSSTLLGLMSPNSSDMSPSKDGSTADQVLNNPKEKQDQERWRRLFLNMRVHLKPTAIAVSIYV